MAGWCGMSLAGMCVRVGQHQREDAIRLPCDGSLDYIAHEAAIPLAHLGTVRA